MKTIKTWLTLSVISSLTVTAFAANTSTVPDISGTYQCKGYDPGGNTNYTNSITVAKNGDTFTFQWLNSSGYPFNLGTGIFNSDLNNAVSVVFWDPKKSDFFGTMFYVISSDGSLQGKWIIQGTTQIGTETCSKK